MAVMVSRAMTATEPDLGVVTAVEETLIEEQVSQPEQLSVGPDEPVSTDVPAFDAMPVPEDSMDSVTEEDLPPLNDEAGNPEQDGDSG